MKEVRLACGTVYTLRQLEDAGISYVPCTHDTPLFPYAHLKNLQRQVTHQAYGKKFNTWKLKGMQGVQIFTGKPTNRFVDEQREYLVDIDIENRLFRRYPETTQSIIKIYRDACREDPCIVRTKSDGRRLSGFSPWYDPKRSFTDKVVDGEDDTKTMLLEFFSLGELSRIDDRYALLEGSLLQIPSVPKTTYQEIHALISEIGTEKSREKRNQVSVVETEQISGLDIHWDANGKSQSFPSQYCQATSHSSHRDTVVFFKNDDGSIVGSCINCNEWWYEVKPPQRTSAPKLLQIHTATAPETESLDENQATRTQHVDAFLNVPITTSSAPPIFPFGIYTTPSNPKTEILLVKDATGTGKSHTILTKSRQQGRRTLATTPYTELAEQALHMAWEAGFIRPRFLKGRQQGWEDSEIADIPVEQRNTSLFTGDNCIMFDVVQQFTDRRIGARLFCELLCPFRKIEDSKEGCVYDGYLSQFWKLADADFLVNCTPNLLFNPAYDAYLKNLIELSEEPTLEEDTISIALGLPPSPKPEAFNLAVIDDYTIQSLYNDQSVTRAEIQRLKEIWEGEQTAEFAKALLPIFTETDPTEMYLLLSELMEKTDTAEVSKQLTQHPRRGTVKQNANLFCIGEVQWTDGSYALLPKSKYAEKHLRQNTRFRVAPFEEVNLEWKPGDTVIIGYTIGRTLMAGIDLTDLAPVWGQGWTLIAQLKALIASVKTPENLPMRVSQETLHFTTPPIVNPQRVPQIALLSATTAPNAVKAAFKGQPVQFFVSQGGQLEWEKGVAVYQYAAHRLTAASTFQYQNDLDGKRKLQEKPMGLTTTAQKRLKHVNRWAGQTEGTSVFISYKDIVDSPEFAALLDNFDIVTHFDRVAGLNIDKLSLLVVFGYPKVNPRDVMNQARIQFASTLEPLPTRSYEELTELTEFIEDGIQITERRYKDKRLEEVRQQLSIDKLVQAVGRARLPRWKNTTTIIFTNAPIPHVTERAILFTDREFYTAETPKDLPIIAKQIAEAEGNGDMEALTNMGVSERTAQRRTEATRKQRKAERESEILRRYAGGETQKQIADALDVGIATVNRVLKQQPF